MEEKFERRRSEEAGQLNGRLMTELGKVSREFAEVRQEMAELKANVARWMSIVWVGQRGTVVTGGQNGA